MNNINLVTPFVESRDNKVYFGMPVHGNYGGRGYTGKQIGGTNYAVKPTSPEDSLYRDHDHGYELGYNGTADLRLARGLELLNRPIQAAFWRFKSLFGKKGDYPELPPWHSMTKPSYSTTAHSDTLDNDFGRGHESPVMVTPPAPLVGVEPNPGPRRSKVVSKASNSRTGRRGALTVRKQMTPYAQSLAITNNVNDVHLARGTISLGVVRTPASTVAGTIISAYDLNPFEIGGRLAKFASLYQRYKFLGGRLIYNPIAGADTTGQLMITRDTDPSLYPNGSRVNVLEESEKMNRMTVSVRDAFAMLIAPQPGLLWTREDDSEPRTTSPGFVTIIDRSGLTNSTTYGSIDFEFVYEFSVPANRGDPLYMLYSSTGTTTNVASSVCTLRANGTDEANTSCVLAGDSQWENWVDPTNYLYIRIPPWTQIHGSVMMTGTGLSASSQLGMTYLNVTSVAFTALINSASTHLASFNVYTTSQVGYFRITYGGTITTVATRQMQFDVVSYDVTIPSAFIPGVESKTPALEDEGEIVDDHFLKNAPEQTATVQVIGGVPVKGSICRGSGKLKSLDEPVRCSALHAN